MLYFWGYFSRFSSIASSLIIMPFALNMFDSESFAIWMIFVTFYSLIVVFDFGLTTTFSRQYNYILAGANSIEKTGMSEYQSETVNKELFGQLYISSRTIFSVITLFSILLLTTVYYFYLHPLALEVGKNISIEWLLYATSIVIGIYSLSYNALFFGTHNVESIYRVCSITNIIFFAIAIILILLKLDLMAVSIARLISALVYLFYAKYEVSARKMLSHCSYQSSHSTRRVLASVIPNASKLGAVTIGNFLITKSSILLVASYLPLSVSGSYSLTLNIFSVIISVSLLYMTIKTPDFNRLRQQKSNQSIVALQKKIRIICLLSFALGALGVAMIGDSLLSAISSRTELPPLSITLLVSLMCILDVNRQVSMNFIMTANRVPFFIPVLITGAICLLATILFFEYDYRIILIPILVQLISQCLFNNWYWTLKEFRELKQILTRESFC